MYDRNYMSPYFCFVFWFYKYVWRWDASMESLNSPLCVWGISLKWAFSSPTKQFKASVISNQDEISNNGCNQIYHFHILLKYCESWVGRMKEEVFAKRWKVELPPSERSGNCGTSCRLFKPLSTHPPNGKYRRKPPANTFFGSSIKIKYLSQPPKATGKYIFGPLTNMSINWISANTL